MAQAKADVQVFSASETTAKAAVLDRLKADTDYQNARILLEEARQAKENSTADSPHAKLALAEEYSHARLRVKRIEELALANDSGLATATRAVNESISKLRNIEDRFAADRARAAGAAERRAAAAQKDREDRTLTAAKLVRNYENNEVSADEWARGRELIISGVVESVGKDFLDDPYVSLSDGTEFSLGGVQCLFSKADTSKLTKLNKGQQVTISGICAGKTLTLVVMRDCRVE